MPADTGTSLRQIRRLAVTHTLGGGTPATSKNPFDGVPFYVNPSYTTSLAASINTASDEIVKSTMQKMQRAASAYWLDKKAKIQGDDLKSMEGILKDAASKSPPELVTFIVYDLPNRDCHAKASNGEICCTYLADGRCDYMASGDCASGLKEYKEKYIDEIVKVLKKYDGQVPVVLIIEPDSLPNLSTNRADPRCGNPATAEAYTKGVKYAVEEIASKTSQVAIYLDAAHGGWLGWKDSTQAFVSTIQSLGLSQWIRGFATNVANYEPLGVMCPELEYCLNGKNQEAPCCQDPCGLSKEWNPANNELNWAMHLRAAMRQSIPDFDPHFVIDTGRNGVGNMREKCAHWCNIRGAGVGVQPTTLTGNTTFIDAYFWLKTPGESDGCTEDLPDGSKCPRFDQDCASSDSLGSVSGEPRAPEAGAWFDYQIQQLARNAIFAGSA